MPAVALNEAVSPAKPLLFFAYQVDGLLTDVAELSFAVYDVERSYTERVAPTAVNLVSARLGNGRYAPTFTPTPPAGGNWAPGTHEIVWTYRLVLAGTQYVYRQRFEVLDPNFFASGAYYVGYADSFALRRTATFGSLEVYKLHELIDSVSRRIETLTGRFFEPRFISTRLSGRGESHLVLGHPLIGLDTISVVGTDAADQLFEIDRTAMRVFNRHLVGLLDPDDRMNPKLEFATDLAPGILFRGEFWKGSQNIALAGVFGYTDPDGSPIGRVPQVLTKAVGILAQREVSDPFGQDISTSQPGRIKSAKTRDQAITFAVGDSSTGAATIGAITGDRTVDDLLIALVRPPEMRLV